MPHRCGIITTRGQKPNAVTQEEGTPLPCTVSSVNSCTAYFEVWYTCVKLLFSVRLPSCIQFSLSVAEYVGNMESRVKPLLESKKELSEEDMEKYGKKDLEAYPHDFLSLNVQPVRLQCVFVCLATSL